MGAYTMWAYTMGAFTGDSLYDREPTPWELILCEPTLRHVEMAALGTARSDLQRGLGCCFAFAFMKSSKDCAARAGCGSARLPPTRAPPST